METPPRVAEREDEHVEDDRAAPEVDPRLAPVDLTLVPRRRLEAHRRPLRRLLRGAQRTHEALHRLITAAIAPRLAQLLDRESVPSTGPRGPAPAGSSRARPAACPCARRACTAATPARRRIPRTVFRSSCNWRAISDFERRSTWNSRCTSRQPSSRTMGPSPSGVTSGPVSAVVAAAPVNNASVMTMPSFMGRVGSVQ